MKYFLIPIVFLFSTSVVSACSFAPDADRFQSLESNIFKYQTVFIGEVVEKTELGNFEGNEFTFKVSQTIKGENQPKRVISSPGHSCGSFFSVGQVGIFLLGTDPSIIDESHPRYLYSSLEEAQAALQGILLTKPAVLIDPEIEVPEIRNGLPEKHNRICTREYAPVCGSIPVQCVQAPCPPVQETYSNRCVMESAGAALVHVGVCKKDKVTEPTILPIDYKIPSSSDPDTTENRSTESVRPPIPAGTVIGPKTNPLDGFVEPLSPPPFDNSPEKPVFDKKDNSFLDKIGNFMHGLFAWLF